MAMTVSRHVTRDYLADKYRRFRVTCSPSVMGTYMLKMEAERSSKVLIPVCISARRYRLRAVSAHTEVMLFYVTENSKCHCRRQLLSLLAAEVERQIAVVIERDRE
jgi:hypothetical protein